MDEKIFKDRTKKLALGIINMTETLPKTVQPILSLVRLFVQAHPSEQIIALPAGQNPRLI